MANVAALMGLAFLAWSMAAGAQTVPGCGQLENAFGPFDYRDPVSRKESLNIVERAHFTPEVEALQRGHTGTVIGDLDYTLRAWPNHHRALAAVGRYSLLGNTRWTNPSVKSAECYFERAIAFRPDDETARMLYANYLLKRGRREAARAQFEEALRIAPNAVELNYNAGLFFVGEGDLERARKHAKVAYEGGYPLPGLRNKILAAEEKKSN